MGRPFRSLAPRPYDLNHWRLGVKIAVVLNSSAGSLLGQPVHKAVDLVNRCFGDAGHQVQCITERGRDLPQAIRKAAALDVDVVVVGGGDGTIATAAHLLSGTGKALGVLPLGTMNLLARDLGIPLDLGEAVEALAQGTVDTIDVAEVNGHPFLNNSVIGFYARMVQHREQHRGARGPGKWFALLRAAWQVFVEHPRLVVNVDLGDGHVRRMLTPIFAVTNGVYAEGFGPILRRETLSEGVIGVYVSQHHTRWQLFKLGLEFLLGRWQRDPAVEMHRVTALTVHSRRKRLRVSNDGEVIVLHTPLQYRLKPGGLKVLRPTAAVVAERDRLRSAG